jgi:integrase
MIDRRFANSYMTDGMEGVHPATKKKRVGALRSYWAWAADNDHFKTSTPLEQRVNPWKASKTKIGTAPKPKKRPFTDDEVRLLLNGAAPEPRYADLLKTLALTGARLSEIVTLRASDVDLDQGFFHIPEGKTEAAARDVPIHPELRQIFQGRTGGKAGEERVFSEIPLPKNPAQGAGHAVSKYVGRLRDRLKVAEGEAEGRRQAAVDAHSFRRWFIRKAVDVLRTTPRAGFNERTVAQVVGHDTEDDPLGMTLVRYAGKDNLETLRACVEAVRLPTDR